MRVRASAASPGNESRRIVPWTSSAPPGKILVIRLQAFGDVVITLPYIQALRSTLPSAEFHYLTREEFSSLPKNMTLFRRVVTIGGGRDLNRQWLKVFSLLPALVRERYDVVIDLQRNSFSRFIRRMLQPNSFCEFDRFSPRTAGDRTRMTIDSLGFPPLADTLPPLEIRDRTIGISTLLSTNFHRSKKTIVLNPAGNFATKNWPLDNYVQFARQWQKDIDRNVQFALIGIDSLRSKAEYLKNQLGDSLVSLIGSTTQSEAFNILQQVEFVLTEDSGLMHMAWISRIPLIALFGSTNSTWSRPMGEYSFCLDSSDLACGACAQPACRFGDTRCLTRHSPEAVITIARELLQKKRSFQRDHA